MKKTLLGLVGLCWLAACASTPLGTGGRPATPNPGQSLAAILSPVSAADLSASWVFGNASEPPAGPVAGCNPGQVLILIQQNDRLQGGVTTCAGPCFQLEKLDGTNKDGQVTLDGPYQGNMDRQAVTVSYRLSYVPQTQHLRGTRDGQPFWAAPFVDRGDAACGPRPL